MRATPDQVKRPGPPIRFARPPKILSAVEGSTQLRNFHHVSPQRSKTLCRTAHTTDPRAPQVPSPPRRKRDGRRSHLQGRAGRRCCQKAARRGPGRPQADQPLAAARWFSCQRRSCLARLRRLDRQDGPRKVSLQLLFNSRAFCEMPLSDQPSAPAASSTSFARSTGRSSRMLSSRPMATPPSTV